MIPYLEGGKHTAHNSDWHRCNNLLYFLFVYSGCTKEKILVRNWGHQGQKPKHNPPRIPIRPGKKSSARSFSALCQICLSVSSLVPLRRCTFFQSCQKGGPQQPTSLNPSSEGLCHDDWDVTGTARQRPGFRNRLPTQNISIKCCCLHHHKIQFWPCFHDKALSWVFFQMKMFDAPLLYSF